MEPKYHAFRNNHHLIMKYLVNRCLDFQTPPEARPLGARFTPLLTGCLEDFGRQGVCIGDYTVILLVSP